MTGIERNNNVIHVKCSFCHFEFDFDETHIPENQKYEMRCPGCDAFLMRKKVSVQPENEEGKKDEQ